MTSEWSPQTATHELADGIFLVCGPASNWAILREGRRWCLVDGGYPGDFDLVRRSAARLGLHPRPEAVLLTHAHIDHLGAALALAADGVPIWCSAAEAPNATGDAPSQISPEVAMGKAASSPLWAQWVRHAIQAGGLETRRLAADQLSLFTAHPGASLDLPRSPQCCPSVGHTPGHAAFLVGAVLLSGDALVTGHATSSIHGCAQSLDPAFHHCQPQAEDAAAQLLELPARMLAPGHGEPLPMSQARASLPLAAHHTVDLDSDHP